MKNTKTSTILGLTLALLLTAATTYAAEQAKIKITASFKEAVSLVFGSPTEPENRNETAKLALLLNPAEPRPTLTVCEPDDYLPTKHCKSFSVHTLQDVLSPLGKNQHLKPGSTVSLALI